MFGIGSTELLVILVVALIVLGPKSLANVSRTLGKAMGEFRRVSTDFQRTLNAEAEEEEQKKRKKEAAKAAREAAKAEAEAAQAAPQAQAQTAEQAAEQTGTRAADQDSAAAQDAPASEAVLDTTAVQAPPAASQAEEGTPKAAAAETAPADAAGSDAAPSGVPAPPEGSPLAEALARTQAEARAAEARLTPSTPASENGGKA